MILSLASIFLLLMLSAFFSATETAFTSLSLMQTEHISSHRGRRGRMVKRLTEDPKPLLATILIGNNLVNIGASALATAMTIRIFGNAAVGFTTGILTLLVLIFAEVTPKSIAIDHNEGIAAFAAYPIWILSKILKPVIWLVTITSSLFTRFFSPRQQGQMSLDGLLHMMNMARDMGIVEDFENHLVRGVFRFNDVTVGAIMTHRTEVFSMDQSITVEEALKPIHDSGYSRIPIYTGEPENITGIVLTKDVVNASIEGRGKESLRTLALDPLFIPTNRRINELFSLFKRSVLNMAVILDEYGGLAGIVSREDVIEELLGELYDENEIMVGEKVTKLGKESYLIQGDTSLHQVHDLLELPLVHGRNVQTIAGYIVESLGRIPRPGEEITIPGARIQIKDVQKNRILTVLCHPEETP